jgi:hypothetical protein
VQRNVRTEVVGRNPHLWPGRRTEKRTLLNDHKNPSSIFELHFAHIIVSKSVMTASLSRMDHTGIFPLDLAWARFQGPCD